MKKYACPICKKRICDSEKELYLTGFCENTAQKADIFLKCKNCKNTIAVAVVGDMEDRRTYENQSSCS